MLRQKRVLAVKAETTPGTAVTLAAADAAYNAFNVAMQPTIEFVNRVGQSSGSQLPGVTATRMGTCTFQTELYNDKAQSIYTALLPAAAITSLDSGLTYSPRTAPPGTSGVKTVTVGLYEDGVRKTLRGAVVESMQINAVVGRPIMVDWTLKGIWDAPIDATILTPTYPTLAPIRFAGSCLSIGSWNPRISAFNLSVNNVVTMREDPCDITGYLAAIVGERTITGSIDPESTLVASMNVYGQWLAHDLQALGLTFAGSPDDFAIAMPKIQYTNIQEGARGVMQIDTINFIATRNAAAGDDELTFNMS